MKSSFLLTAVLTLSTLSAWGQTKKVKSLPSTPVPTKTTVTETADPETKSSFDRFYDRLKIGYFGVVTSPNFDEMEKGEWDYGALSPEFSGGSNRDSWPTSLWNQINFRYNFGAKMDFVFLPRFMIPLSHPVAMKAPEDRSFIEIEDFLVGFQGVVASSDDKKFNLWIRPAIRLSTSRLSRNDTNAGFGQLSHNLEFVYLPTYDFNKQWQVGLFGQVRQWVYENRYNWSRLRLYNAPYVQYTFNDTTKMQVYYEHMLENNKRWESINGKKPVFKDVWQNVMVGVAKDITPKLNVFPYISCFVNDNPITDKSLWLGMWISYTIK